jgi:hypothetical protein
MKYIYRYDNPHVRIHISHIRGQYLWLQSQSLYGSQLIIDVKAVEKFLQKPKILVITMTQSILSKIQFFSDIFPAEKEYKEKLNRKRKLKLEIVQRLLVCITKILFFL